MSKYACRRRLFLTLLLCVASQAVLAQPSNAADQQIDLTGNWIDSDHEVTVSVSGTTVTATYKKPIFCTRSDGSKDQSTEDFKGELSTGRPMMVTGEEANTCVWWHEQRGKTNPCGVEGFLKARFNLKLSEDAQSLEGTYFSCLRQQDESMVLTRPPCYDLTNRLNVANDQGPRQLFALCEKNQSQCPGSCAPYCAVADCFGEQVQVVQLSPATAPGLLAGFGRLVASLMSWPPLPDVPTLQNLPREPVLITKDSCVNALFLMRKAYEIQSAMGMKNQQQVQKPAIECLETFCKTRGWRTQ
jgi:hypothetical protein